MSTPEAPAQQQEPTQRGCPRCGAALQAGQDWCLSCGLAVTTRIERPPTWRAPAAIVGGVLILCLAALLAFTFAEISDDAERAAQVTPSPTPAPTASPVPTAAPTLSPSPMATATATETPGAEQPPSSGSAAGWPAGETAYTVVVLSTTSKEAAEERAQELTSAGTPAGVLRSSDFSSLREGYWVVFSGQYDTADEATQAAEDLGASAAGAYVRYVEP